MNTLARIFTASLAGALAISSAHAGILGFGTRVSPYLPSLTSSPVPLKDDGATTVTFRTARDNTVVAVTYNAECMGNSGVVGDHVEVWIAVDGMIQQQDFTFCSALVAGPSVYVAASHRAVVRVPKAGLHTVQVFAKLSEGSDGGELDDSSIVIED